MRATTVASAGAKMVKAKESRTSSQSSTAHPPPLTFRLAFSMLRAAEWRAGLRFTGVLRNTIGVESCVGGRR